MKVNKINESLVTVGDYAIEEGPNRLTAIANSETLADSFTAPHYSLGQMDSKGQTIEEGKEFEYLDILSDKVWYVYKDGAQVAKFKSQIEAVVFAASEEKAGSENAIS